jgi:hypothetical protein
MLRLCVILAILCLCGVAWSADPLTTSKLAAPVRITAGDGFVDCEVGHSDPLMMDWNGDGKRDLLVGQFGAGKLRIYLNSGTDTDPKFDKYEFLKIGTDDASVPSG